MRLACATQWWSTAAWSAPPRAGAGEVRAGRRAGRGARTATLGRGAARPARGAFAPDNAALLDALAAWKSIREITEPYRRMRVWDASGGGELAIDADALGRRELGWIVEHGLLVDRLWAALPAAGVSAVPGEARIPRAGRMAFDSGLDSGRMLEAHRRGRRWRRFRVARARRHPGRCARLSATRRGRLCRNRIAARRHRLAAVPARRAGVPALRRWLVRSIVEPAGRSPRACSRWTTRRSTKRSPMRSTPGSARRGSPSKRAAFPLRRQLAQHKLRGPRAPWPATPRTWSIRWRDRA